MREQKKEAGTKEDAGKLRLDLIPFASMMGMAAVLTDGASRYSKNIAFCPKEVFLLCNSQSVIQIEKFTVEECVVPVMKNGSGKTILDILNGNKKMPENGSNGIQIKYEQHNRDELQIHDVGQEIRQLKEKMSLRKSMVSQKRVIKNFLKRDAIFAEVLNTCTWIMTIQQENCVEYCVVSAMRDWECWEILLPELKKRELISSVVDLHNDSLFITGDRNWENGISWSRVFGALLRHLFAWWFRIDLDEKSKLHHLDHAMCCLAFLRHYTFFNQDKDNRPRYTNGPKIIEKLFSGLEK